MEELQRRQAARSELGENLNILANSQLTLTNTVNRFVESLKDHERPLIVASR